ncbi:hypothetical protein HK098_004539 [Nowakowskiella sp. JEL0407]|nr:hypothetical protein HK098_004539 [Nowakowskiella sp. JEL0407]
MHNNHHSSSVILALNHPHGHLTQLQRFRNNFIAGGIALSTAFAFTHPIDTLKTRLQAATGTAVASSHQTAIFSRDMFKILAKGFFTSVVGAGPQGGLRLATYEFTKSHILRHPHSHIGSSSSISYIPQHNNKTTFFGIPTTSSPMLASALSAITGDTVSSIIKVPREVITARLQTDYVSSTSVDSVKKGSFNVVVQQIWKEEGIAGFFRGFMSTTARDWPFMVILFTTYESFKQNHRHIRFPFDDDEDEDDIPITTLKSTIFGGISGGLAGYLTTPFDVVKTKIMTYKKSSANERISMYNVARDVYRARSVQLVSGGSGVVNSIRPCDVFFTGSGARGFWWFW